MKNVLIFSTCLVLILLLGGMPKTDVKEFDGTRDSELIMTDFEGACFASSLISVYYKSKESNQQNMTLSFLIWSHASSKSPILNRLFYVPQMVGWATWIGISYRRQRPYRNPRRRFRLNKKQRRRLQQHLCSLLAQENSHLRDKLSSNVGWV